MIAWHSLLTRPPKHQRLLLRSADDTVAIGLWSSGRWIGDDGRRLEPVAWAFFN